MILVACAGALAFSGSADASRSGPLHTRFIHEDSFVNYDFTKKEAKRTTADWGLDLIFFGNANINKVKAKLAFRYAFPGTSMHAHVNNNRSGWTWDTDRGIKNLACPTYKQTAEHMRLYAPSSTDYFKARGWGTFIVASTHYDHQECTKGVSKWSGESEKVEKAVAQLWAATYGGNVQFDAFNMRNRMMTRRGGPIVQGSHRWLQNGWATLVLVQ